MPEEDPPTYWEPAAGEQGMTGLHSAAYGGDLEAVRAELRAGADVNARDQGGWTPLHWVVDMGMVGEGREEILTTLIQAGAEIDARSSEGETPLLRVCSSGNEDLARLLIAAGADRGARDREGWTPFGRAVRDGYHEIVALFLDHGASPDEHTPGGETMLELAKTREWQEVVRVLEDWGGARKLGTDWLPMLANAPEDFDEALFCRQLEAIELGSGVRIAFRASLGGHITCIPDHGELMRDFIADYHRFLDRTSLLLLTHHYSKDLCLVFRDRFRYNGSAEDWAKLQSMWATGTRYHGHPWTWKNFLYGCSDVEMCHGMKRLLDILKRHRPTQSMDGPA